MFRNAALQVQQQAQGKGYAFIDDGSLIEIFERNFEYTETEDQLSAIYDVYNDMESETPMAY